MLCIRQRVFFVFTTVSSENKAFPMIESGLSCPNLVMEFFLFLSVKKSHVTLRTKLPKLASKYLLLWKQRRLEGMNTESSWFVSVSVIHCSSGGVLNCEGKHGSIRHTVSKGCLHFSMESCRQPVILK